MSTEADKELFITFMTEEIAKDMYKEWEIKDAVRKRKHNSCTQCGLYADGDVVTFGGSPHQGWYTLERIDGSSRIPRCTNNGPWKFCCKECLVKFLTDDKKEVTNG
jgi:hypothetical protein